VLNDNAHQWQKKILSGHALIEARQMREVLPELKVPTILTILAHLFEDDCTEASVAKILQDASPLVTAQLAAALHEASRIQAEPIAPIPKKE